MRWLVLNVGPSVPTNENQTEAYKLIKLCKSKSKKFGDRKRPAVFAFEKRKNVCVVCYVATCL